MRPQGALSRLPAAAATTATLHTAQDALVTFEHIPPTMRNGCRQGESTATQHASTVPSGWLVRSVCNGGRAGRLRVAAVRHLRAEEGTSSLAGWLLSLEQGVINVVKDAVCIDAYVVHAACQRASEWLAGWAGWRGGWRLQAEGVQRGHGQGGAPE